MSLQPLAYDIPRPPQPTEWLHRIAQLCGVLPLACGAFVFLTFLATRNPFFVLVGMWTILVGLCAAFVGVVCACIYLFQARQGGSDSHPGALRAGLRDVAIIALNFPVALAMALIGALLVPGW